MEEKGGKALIITHDIIDAESYDDLTNVYEFSDIRSWLNNYFYDTAFNENEKKKILLTDVDNSLSSIGDSENIYACKDTKDNIFLLSVKEARTYYTSDELRKAKGTDYAKNHKLWLDSSSGNSCWFLRSPENKRANYVHSVYHDGGIFSNIVDSTTNGIRPACWIDIDDVKKENVSLNESNDLPKKQTEIKNEPAIKNETESSIYTVKAGDNIKFGSYYSKDDKTLEPLKWDILDIKDGKALIITHNIIDTIVFEINESNNYEKSSIRKWLNNDFYNTAFNAEEKKKIQLTLVDNSLESTCQNTNKYVCNNTNDNVFIL